MKQEQPPNNNAFLTSEAKTDKASEFQSFWDKHKLQSQHKYFLGIEKGVDLGINEGIKRGIRKGERLGEQRYLEKAALMLSSKGFSPKQIHEMLEIPLRKIQAIIKKHEADKAEPASE